eukprot:TRINITY_DN15015_c0_g1_i4.p1 TRINITY_DN15015_c0_g1~~TRINITY_DN15015_c0_g1_i4.p1  ORF type:complete len:311 (-),score=72.13 TRINITY_DN15015_c0_g1_i4:63-995(-)
MQSSSVQAPSVTIHRDIPEARTYRVVCLSDTHNQLQSYVANGMIPEGDILIHAGDFSDYGTEAELAEFCSAFASLPHRHKIVICGNHERQFENSSPQQVASVLGCVLPGEAKDEDGQAGKPYYLHHQSVEIEGIRFFGSPYNPTGPGFKLTRGAALAGQWATVPADIDILITHSPPRAVMDVAHGNEDGVANDTAGHERPPPPPAEWNVPDQVVSGRANIDLMAAIRMKHKAKAQPPPACQFCPDSHPKSSHWGCSDLLQRVQQIRPKAHIFGHVHEGNGFLVKDGTLFINAAMLENSRAICFDLIVSSQ